MKKTWKQLNWDKWTTSRKVLHIISVTVSGIIVMAMGVSFVIMALYLFAFEGFILDLRDTMLSDLSRWLFGG